MDVSEVTSLHRSNVAASNGVAHKFGGSIDNAVVKKRSLDPTQACETCVLCCRLLGRVCFWPEQWRHRTRDDIKMKCQECSPTCPKGQPTGYLQLNEQRSREAAAKPFTCQVCERTLPRTQFRAGKNGKFDLRNPQTCEQCRAEGKLQPNPLTCQVCERTMPRTQFPPGKNGKFDLRYPQTCEQCRAEGKHPMTGRKKRRLEPQVA